MTSIDFSSISLSAQQFCETDVCYTRSLSITTLFRVQKLVGKFIGQITSADIIQKIDVTGATQKML